MGIVNMELPDELHRRAKAQASLRGESLKALIARAVERETERLEADAERGR